MDTQAIRSQMPTLVHGHVPSNVRSFKFNIFDGQPKVSALGFHIDPKPFEGKVIARTGEAIVVKTGRAEFAVLDRSLVTAEPEEGTKVHVEPYARRRFDGLRADTPEACKEFTADGQPYTVKRYVLGSAPAKLPIPEPRCPELQALVQQLEQMPAPDGFRRITHMLVDAGARDFSWVDPLPDDIIASPPAIGFTVSSAKFQGQVTVLYERGDDLYAVELRRDGELLERVDEVYCDSLGDVLERLVDDGHWRQIVVNVIGPKASRQRQMVSA
ncbi:GTPase [Burkholderia multivorans]|uniref:GTPase n=1 Tax=Burkholderia multivorans TaxID=87883 RepID=UPI001C9656BE|nr:GTPase [Burkholderia multivorans]MBY4673886.1 GTPase [Burkholderia multivorans]